MNEKMFFFHSSKLKNKVATTIVTVNIYNSQVAYHNQCNTFGYIDKHV